MTIRCSVCTLKKDEQYFKRKNKMYKTCNKCSNYYISRRKKIGGNSDNNKNNEKIINTNSNGNDNNKIQSGNSDTFDKSTNTMKDKSTNTPPITNGETNMLSRIFLFGHLFPVSIQHKYQHIKQLENELLNEIDVLVRKGLE